jgi:hypothetical protein
MKKKSQITIFIIVGITILFVIALFYYFLAGVQDKETSTGVTNSEVNKEFAPFQMYIENCIKDSSIKAGFYIGEHGGYDLIPLDSISYTGNNIAKYYDKTDAKIYTSVSFADMESNYANVVERYTFRCVNDFVVFEKMGYKIDYSYPQTEVVISLDSVKVTTKFPVNVSKGFANTQFEEFPAIRVPLRIGRYYQIAQTLVSYAISSPTMIQLSYLNELSKSESLEYHVPYAENDKALVYFLIDKREDPDYKKIILEYNNNKNFAYIFGMRFD